MTKRLARREAQETATCNQVGMALVKEGVHADEHAQRGGAMNGQPSKDVKRGAVVVFSKPNEDEDAGQRYVIMTDDEGTGRVDIAPIGEDWDNWAIRPVQTVLVEDLVCAS